MIINTAALHDLPSCEENYNLAFDVNARGVYNIACAAKKNDASIIHISTDYVFNGEKTTPYIESDLPNPLNTYGITKLAGEYYLNSILNRYYIIRTSGLYGLNECRAKGGNFVKKMISRAKKDPNLNVVGNEILTPTFTQDLAEQILLIIDKKPEYGTYHITNEGECSWFEFTQEIFVHVKIPVKLNEVTSDFFPSLIKRPNYSVLKNFNLKSQNLNKMRNWKESLKSYLSQLNSGI